MEERDQKNAAEELTDPTKELEAQWSQSETQEDTGPASSDWETPREQEVEVVPAPVSDSVQQEAAYRLRRSKNWNGLLVMVVLSAVNMIAFFTDIGIAFPYSSYLVSYDLPFAAYTWNLVTEEAVIVSPQAVAVVCVVGVVILSLYLLLYFLGRKYIVPVWIALVLFVLDTLLALINLAAIPSLIIDVAFHVWLIVNLINTIRMDKEIKKLRIAA